MAGTIIDPFEEIEIDEAQAMDAALLSNHRKVPPFGLAGGEPGRPGDQWVERADGTVTRLGGRDKTKVGPGDVFVIQTPSGGGYGEPD